MVLQCNKGKLRYTIIRHFYCDTVTHYLGKFQYMQDTGKMPYMIYDQFTEEATMKKVHSYIIGNTTDRQYRGQLDHAI